MDDKYKYLNVFELEPKKFYRAKDLSTDTTMDVSELSNQGFEVSHDDAEQGFDEYGYFKVIKSVNDDVIVVKPLNIDTLTESGTLEFDNDGKDYAYTKSNIKNIENQTVDVDFFDDNEFVEIDFKSAMKEIYKQLVSDYKKGTNLNFKENSYMNKLNLNKDRTFIGDPDYPASNYIEWKKNDLGLSKEDKLSDAIGDAGIFEFAVSDGFLDDEPFNYSSNDEWHNYIKKNYKLQ
jgi:hypothetical protein